VEKVNEFNIGKQGRRWLEGFKEPNILDKIFCSYLESID
jgi:hypothetical protein